MFILGINFSYSSRDRVYAADLALTDDVDRGHEEFPREFLRSIDLPGLPPSVLQLKEGIPVMLLRNLRPQEGLCNGTRLLLTSVRKHVLTGVILTGDFKGCERLIPRIPLHSLEGDLPFILQRRQFPVRPCFAMTINKSQGQSLGAVGLDLRVPAFSHGQLYVALSRVTDISNLSILLRDGVDTTVNVVYEEVLRF